MVTWSLWPHPVPADENEAIHVETNISVILKSTNETGSHFVYWKVVIVPVSTTKSRDWFTVNCESDLWISSSRTMSEVRVRTSESLQISKTKCTNLTESFLSLTDPSAEQFRMCWWFVDTVQRGDWYKDLWKQFLEKRTCWLKREENVTCKLRRSCLFAHNW